MRILLSISFLFCILYSHAQITFTTYHDKKGKETKIPEEAHYIKTLTINNDEQGTVSVRETFVESNKTKLIGTFKSFKEKHYIGTRLEAYENGKMKSKINYSFDGKVIDTAYHYHPNGKLKLAFEYPNNVEKGKTKVTDTLILVYNDSTGKRHLVDGNGYAEIDLYNEIEKGNYENHKRVGEWTGEFMNGKYTFKETYQNGKIISGISIDSAGNNYPYTEKNFMTPPDYPGGIKNFQYAIINNFRYPKEAISNNVNGTMKASFKIDPTGTLKDIVIEQGLGYGTEQEFINVLKRTKKWTPGIKRGVPVNVKYSIPLRINVSR